MGSPNFAVPTYPALGYVQNFCFSDGDITEYRLAYPDDELSTADIVERLQFDESEFACEMTGASHALVDELNRFLWQIDVNPLANFEQNVISFELETAYNDNSHRIVIVNECENGSDGYDYESYYDDHHYTGAGYQHPKDLPFGMTFGQFKNCVYKTLDFANYALRELANRTPLIGVGGGYTGGAYEFFKNDEQDHNRFSAVFERFWERLKQNPKLFYI